MIRRCPSVRPQWVLPRPSRPALGFCGTDRGVLSCNFHKGLQRVRELGHSSRQPFVLPNDETDCFAISIVSQAYEQYGTHRSSSAVTRNDAVEVPIGKRLSGGKILVRCHDSRTNLGTTRDAANQTRPWASASAIAMTKHRIYPGSSVLITYCLPRADMPP